MIQNVTDYASCTQCSPKDTTVTHKNKQWKGSLPSSADCVSARPSLWHHTWQRFSSERNPSGGTAAWSIWVYSGKYLVVPTHTKHTQVHTVKQTTTG